MNRWVVALIVVIQLAACGGGHGGGAGFATSAPSNLSYPAAPALAVGTAMSPLTPTVTGTVTSYSVSPALPAGLSIDAMSGVISGTPTAAAASASYTVTASNTGGSTTAMVTLQVDDIKPAISYAGRRFVLPVGSAVSIAPVGNGGGSVTAWSVNPTLPAGLTIDSSTGTISGTPTAISPAASYTITAQNSGGNNSFGVHIQVVSKVLLDLGHTVGIARMVADGARILSQDQGEILFQSSVARCNLWDAASDTLVAAISCASSSIALAGATAVVSGWGSLLVLSSADGHLLSTIDAPVSWWQLASDGSYVVTGTAAALTAYSPTGAALFTASGDYSNAKVFAAPTQIQVALGPKGADVIETISAAGGASSTGPKFNGTFSEWFADGARFQTTVSSTVYTYSSAGVQQAIVSLPAFAQIGGSGNWFWTVTDIGTVNVYAVGASSAAYTSASDCCSASGAAQTLAIQSSTGQNLVILDLSGGSLTQQSYPLPNGGGGVAYAATSAANWFVGFDSGAVLDGSTISSTPKYLALGGAQSMAGGGSHVAAAFGAGKILVVNVQTKALETSIDFLCARLQMSADGTVLAGQGGSLFAGGATDSSLKVYSLPSGAVINTWPYTYGTGTQLLDFSLAPGGTLVGQVTVPGSGPPYTRQVTAAAGGGVLWSDSPSKAVSSVAFSPDGTLIAAATDVYEAVGVGTNIYTNYTLTAAAAGWPVGWIDNASLLTNIYVTSARNAPLGAYSAAKVVSSAGTVLDAPNLPEITRLQPIGVADEIFAPTRNSIYDVTTGALIFGTGTLASYPDTPGATAAGYIAFSSAAGLWVADQY